MDKQQAIARLKAAAWAIAADWGIHEAQDILDRVKVELRDEQWRKPSSQ